ncbi:hypothetical protein Ancab_026375 [Ancistrocladus abbreviatus]
MRRFKVPQVLDLHPKKKSLTAKMNLSLKQSHRSKKGAKEEGRGEQTRRISTKGATSQDPRCDDMLLEGSEVNDSQFVNMNKVFHNQEDDLSLKQIWGFLKKIKVVERGSEREIIQKIKEMELQGSKMFQALGQKKQGCAVEEIIDAP